MDNYVFDVRRKLRDGFTEYRTTTAAKARTYEGALKQIKTRYPEESHEYVFLWTDKEQTARYWAEKW